MLCDISPFTSSSNKTEGYFSQITAVKKHTNLLLNIIILAELKPIS